MRGGRKYVRFVKADLERFAEDIGLYPESPDKRVSEVYEFIDEVAKSKTQSQLFRQLFDRELERFKSPTPHIKT